MTEFFALPARDVEDRIARRLLNQEPPLDRRILEDLVGRPKRYTELEPLLEGPGDNVLTKALNRLREEGVVQQGIDVDRDHRVYHLTELGEQVLARIEGA